jgi:hypothetical protein
MDDYLYSRLQQFNCFFAKIFYFDELYPQLRAYFKDMAYDNKAT